MVLWSPEKWVVLRHTLHRIFDSEAGLTTSMEHSCYILLIPMLRSSGTRHLGRRCRTANCRLRSPLNPSATFLVGEEKELSESRRASFSNFRF
jgi:hypothetical protein